MSERLFQVLKSRKSTAAGTILWAAAVGYSAYGCNEAYDRVNQNPLIAAHTDLDLAKKELQSRQISTKFGSINSFPSRENAINSMRSAAEAVGDRGNIDDSIKTEIMALVQKPASLSDAAYADNIMEINRIQSQIRKLPDYSPDPESDFSKSGYTVLSLAMAGAVAGAIKLARSLKL